MIGQSDAWTNAARSLRRQTEKSISRAIAGTRLVSDAPAAEVGSSPCEVVLKKDRMRLLHYLGGPEEKNPVPILLVYALINRPYILDL